MASAVCALSRVSVLAGGPGTGKTTTVSRLLALLREQDPTCRIALAAPTGKAAARLGEAVRSSTATLPPEDRARLGELSAMTLHRLLGRRPDARTRFKHDARNRLPVRGRRGGRELDGVADLDGPAARGAAPGGPAGAGRRPRPARVRRGGRGARRPRRPRDAGRPYPCVCRHPARRAARGDSGRARREPAEQRGERAVGQPEVRRGERHPPAGDGDPGRRRRARARAAAGRQRQPRAGRGRRGQAAHARPAGRAARGRRLVGRRAARSGGVGRSRGGAEGVGAAPGAVRPPARTARRAALERADRRLDRRGPPDRGARRRPLRRPTAARDDQRRRDRAVQRRHRAWS